MAAQNNKMRQQKICGHSQSGRRRKHNKHFHCCQGRIPLGKTLWRQQIRQSRSSFPQQHHYWITLHCYIPPEHGDHCYQTTIAESHYHPPSNIRQYPHSANSDKHQVRDTQQDRSRGNKYQSVQGRNGFDWFLESVSIVWDQVVESAMHHRSSHSRVHNPIRDYVGRFLQQSLRLCLRTPPTYKYLNR